MPGTFQSTKPNRVKRPRGSGADKFVATFEASELKALRSAVSGYYDLLTVSVRTVEAFEEEI